MLMKPNKPHLMAVSYLLHSFLGMYLMMPVVAMDEPFEQVPLPRFLHRSLMR